MSDLTIVAIGFVFGWLICPLITHEIRHRIWLYRFTKRMKAESLTIKPSNNLSALHRNIWTVQHRGHILWANDKP